MKKHAILLTLLITILTLLPSCALAVEPGGTTQPASTLASTPTANALKRVTPSVVSEAPPTNTSLPPTDEPTTLPESPIPPILATVTITPEPIKSFTPGYIAFLKSDNIGSANELYDLYFAIPGVSPDEWQIINVVNDLTARDMFPSPDHRQIVLPQFQDSNGDGRIVPNEGVDSFDIDIFNVLENRLENLTEEQFYHSAQISWHPNNRYFVFPKDSYIFQADTELFEVQRLGSYNLSQVSWSPDNKWLAGIGRGEPNVGLYLLNPQTDEIVSVAPEQEMRGLFWSPNGQYLAYTGRIGAGLFVLNLNTMEIKTLVSPEDTATKVDWSNDGQLLAFIDDQSSLNIWDTVTDEVQILIELSDFNIIEGPPRNGFIKVIWSPDDLELALIIYDDQQQIKLVIINIQDNSHREIFSSTRIISSRYSQFQLLSWSLNGEWLLINAEPNNQPGLYIVSHEGGEPYLILKTGIYYFTNSNYASDVTWLNVIPGQQFPENISDVTLPNANLEEKIHE